MSDIVSRRKTRELRPNGFRESLHDALTERLRTMILLQHLKPGDRINELELSAALGVSRTPMRESLKVLASEKLVTLFPYRGAIVSHLSPDLIEHLFEVESIIESQAAVLACSRATQAELVKFETLHQRMLSLFRKGEKSSYFDINQTLHNLLVEMSHNPCLQETHATVMTQIKRARYAALILGDRWRQSVEQHNDILAALKARDHVRLPGLISNHVLETGRLIVEALRTEVPNVQSA